LKHSAIPGKNIQWQLFSIFNHVAHDGALLGCLTQIRLSATNHPLVTKNPKLQSTFVLRQPGKESRGLKASNCFFRIQRRNATLIRPSYPTPRTRDGICSWK
jgi:hypothetical protein